MVDTFKKYYGITLNKEDSGIFEKMRKDYSNEQKIKVSASSFMVKLIKDEHDRRKQQQ